MNEIELEITGFGKGGAGIGRAGRKRYLVDFAYPGDRVLALPVSRKKARLLKILRAGDARVEPRCEHFSVCGSCRWQGLDYGSQLRYKGELIEKLFSREVEVEPSPRIWYYRNRMDFTIAENAIGMRRYSSFAEVESAEGCLLLSKESDEIIRLSRKFFRKRELAAYNLLNKQGFLRYLVVREGKFTGDRLISVVTTAGEFPLESYADALGELAESFVWAINDSPADVSYGEISSFEGRDYLEERLADIEYRIPAFSFFQTNPYQAERMLVLVRKMLGSAGRLLDLYCGVGTFSLALADLAGEVLGIEEDAKAIEAAGLNAKLNEISNAHFIAGRAEDVLPGLEKRFDVAVVDPPRAGLHPRVVRALNTLRPEVVVYVSCNPRTQAEDIRKLDGYELEELKALDMFPHTPHVESIALLTR